ncbi:hypothetical protein HpDR57_17590 [Helicobacter pylori]
MPPTTKIPPKDRFKKYRLIKLGSLLSNLKNAIFFYNQRSMRTKPNFSPLAIILEKGGYFT